MATYNDTPLEIICAPYTVWRAPVATAFPVVDAAPSGSWTKIGTNGNVNYTEGGVTVKHGQTLKKIRGVGSTLVLKMVRTEEEHIISLMLMDLTLAQFSPALNGNSITTTAASSGVAGNKAINLERGLLVTQYALLVRGASPEYDGIAQYEIPIVGLISSQDVKFSKDDPAALQLEFEAIRHSSLGAGLLRVQTAAAS